MRHRSIKAKGRRLQTTVAKMLANHLRLTIEASPPAKPRLDADHIRWVPEGEADLRVRPMSEAGADVVLMSKRAKGVVRLDNLSLYIECKNAEQWSFDANFWRSGLNAFVTKAFLQTEAASGDRPNNEFLPVVVLGKNNWPPLIVWPGTNQEINSLMGRGCPILTFGSTRLAMTNLDDFISFLLVRRISDHDNAA